MPTLWCTVDGCERGKEGPSPKAFARKDNLKTHIETVHPEYFEGVHSGVQFHQPDTSPHATVGSGSAPAVHNDPGSTSTLDFHGAADPALPEFRDHDPYGFGEFAKHVGVESESFEYVQSLPSQNAFTGSEAFTENDATGHGAGSGDPFSGTEGWDEFLNDVSSYLSNGSHLDQNNPWTL